MTGPLPRGTFTKHLGPRASERFAGLTPGERYRVARPFADFDGVVHPVGETWTFLGFSFLPYEDGLSLFVSLDGDNEWNIRMRCVPEAQGPIVDAIDRYVRPAVFG